MRERVIFKIPLFTRSLLSIIVKLGIFMMISPEETFYSTYAETTPCLPSDATAKEFEYGKRYYICKKSFDSDPLVQRQLIVELGCGDGHQLLYLREKYGFERSVGLDLGFSQEHEIGESVFLPSNLNNKWQLDDGSVDVLIAMMVIEHLFDPFFSFKEISRVLNVDGRAFVNLPLVTSVKNRLRLLGGLIPTTSIPYSRWELEGHWDGFHLHYFTLGSIHDLAKSANLSIVSVHGVGVMKKIKDLMPALLCSEISFEVRKK
jgi:SAM-dependent methyltransferase